MRIPTYDRATGYCANGRFLLRIVLLAVVIALAGNVKAANKTWDGGASGFDANWLSGTNWNPNGTPVANDLLFFDNSTKLNNTNNFTAGTQFNGITFVSGASSFVLWGNTVNLAGGVTNADNSLQTINLDLALTGNRTFAVNSSGNLAIGGIISDTGGSFGLTKTGTGPGVLILSGVNTYSGVTTIGAGTLQLGNASALGTTAGNTVVSSGAALDLNGQTIGAEALTLSGTGIGGSGVMINNSGTAASLSGAVTLNTASSIGGNGNIALSGTVSGNTGLTKIGTGTLALSGTNTYTGVTTIDAGVLLLNSASALGGSNLVINGGVLGLGANDFTRALGIGNNQVQFTGTGGGFAAYGADRNVNLGSNSATLVWNSTASFLANGDTFFLGASNATHTVTFQNPINLNGANRAVQVDNGSAEVDAVLSGQITNNTGTGSLTKTGFGTLSLSASNSYNGITAINEGVLRVTHNNALGTTAAGVTIADGAALELANSVAVGNEAITSLAGTGIGNSGALRNVSGSNSWAGNITLANSPSITRINSDSGTLTINGTVSETGNSFKTLTVGGAGNVTVNGNINENGSDLGLTKDGTGTLTLASASSYSLVTTVSGGVMLLNHTNALPGGIGTAGGASALTINGGVVGLGAGNFSRGLGNAASQVQFTGSGGFAAFGADRTVNLGGASAGVTWNSGSFVPTGSALILGANNATHTLTFQNPINFNGALRTVQVNDGAAKVDAILSGQLSGTGASGLIKTGNGTLSLTGSNTYAGGTIINAGILSINNTTGSATGTGSVTLNGGMLGGNGIISGSITNRAGGTISAGNSVGTLMTGTQTWEGSSTLSFEISDVDAGAGTGWDLIISSGSLNVDGTSADKVFIDIVSLQLDNNPGLIHDFNSSSPYVWTIITTTTGIFFEPGESESTAFDILTDELQNSTDGGTFYLALANDGKDLNLVFAPNSVPEPSVAALALIGMAGLMVIHRVRKPWLI